jgi:hypothetical protein
MRWQEGTYEHFVPVIVNAIRSLHEISRPLSIGQLHSPTRKDSTCLLAKQELKGSPASV